MEENEEPVPAKRHLREPLLALPAGEGEARLALGTLEPEWEVPEGRRQS